MPMLNPQFEIQAAKPSIAVNLGERSYEVYVGVDVLRTVDLSEHCLGQHVLIVSNETIAPMYLAQIRKQLASKTLEVCLLPDGEMYKTLQGAEQIFQRLSMMRASRDVTLIALGGGVIGDITGFAAALWMRGVRFLQIPTSLLAMVDSSVGGKTAVNLSSGKNLVGAFWQPSAVFVDINMLKTLPKVQLAAGFAEVIKAAAIIDADYFAWLEQHAESLMQLDLELLEICVRRAIEHKATIVMRDERETGDRMLLNFGHTFGHALETAHDYRGLLHGQAVAIGMCCAAQLCSDQNAALRADQSRLEKLLLRFQLPIRDNIRLRISDLVSLMRLDKKAVSGELRLILWKGIGKAFVGKATDETIINAWRGRVDAIPESESLQSSLA
jgi:3-dehydroquinate synthase